MSQGSNVSVVHVNVSIAGRNYRMACEAGDEQRIEDLAAKVDARIIELTAAFGNIDESRLTVMAAFSFADDLAQLERHLDEEKNKLAAAQDLLAAQEQQTVDAINAVAERIENITADLTPTVQA